MPLNKLKVESIAQPTGTLNVLPVEQYRGINSLSVSPQYANPINQAQSIRLPNGGISNGGYSRPSFTNEEPWYAGVGRGAANVAGGIGAAPFVGAGEVFNRFLNAPAYATGGAAINMLQGKPANWRGLYNSAANDLTDSVYRTGDMIDRTAGTNVNQAVTEAYNHPKTTAAFTTATALAPIIPGLTGEAAAATTAPNLYRVVKGAETASEIGLGGQVLAGTPQAYNQWKNADPGADKAQAATEGILNLLLGGVMVGHGATKLPGHARDIHAAYDDSAIQATVNRIASDPALMQQLSASAPQIVAAIANGDHTGAAYGIGSMLYKGTPGFEKFKADGVKAKTDEFTGRQYYEVTDKNARFRKKLWNVIDPRGEIRATADQGQDAFLSKYGSNLAGLSVPEVHGLKLKDILSHDKLSETDPAAMDIPIAILNRFDRGPEKGDPLGSTFGFFDGTRIVLNGEKVADAMLDRHGVFGGHFDRLNHQEKQAGHQAIHGYEGALRTLIHEATHAADHRAGHDLSLQAVDVDGAKSYDEFQKRFQQYLHSDHEVRARAAAERGLHAPEGTLNKTDVYDAADVNMVKVRRQFRDRAAENAKQAADDQALLGTMEFDRKPGTIKINNRVNPGKRETKQILKERKAAAAKVTERDAASKATNLGRNIIIKGLESQPEAFRYDKKKAKLEGKTPNQLDSLVHHTDVLSRSGDIANKFMKDNGLTATVLNTRKAGLDPEVLGQYATDKHLLELADEGKKASGRDLRESKQVVADLEAKYEPFRKQLTDYSHKLVDLLHESGLINDGAHEYLQTHYQDYVPLQRLFSPEELDAIHAGKSSAGSITKQTIVRRLEGSGREIKNPIEALIQMTNAAAKQVESNRGANLIYQDALKHGAKMGLTVLRNAEDQRQLGEIYKESKELQAQRRANEKVISRKSAQARKLATVIANLERKGLLVRLREGSNEVAGKGEAFRYVTREALHDAKRMVKKGTDSFHVIGAAREISGQMKTHLTITSEPTAADVRRMVEGLINSDPGQLRKIRNMQELRQGKHDALMSEINDLKSETDAIKEHLKEKYSEASLLRQANQKGKAIVTGHDNGTKFVVEVPRELKESLNNQSREATSDLLKTIAPTAQVGRMGATALNLGFSLVANVVKDPVSGFVNSNHGMRMADPRTWAQAFAATVKPDGAVAKRLRLNEMYLKTYYDSGRQETKMTVDEMGSHASPAARAQYLATHPGKAINQVEDVMSFGERFNRNWQAMTYLYGGKARGKVGDELVAYMQKGAWKNTVDFNRGGTVTRELNMIDQFLNAAVQGTRTLGVSVRDRPLQTSAKIGLVAGVIPAILTAYNMQDDNKEVYSQIPQYEKENNLIFIMPGAKRDPETGHLSGVIKVPMSNEIARLADITRMGVEAHIDQGTIDAKKVIADLVQTSTGMNVDSPMAFLGNFTPQIVKDFAEPAMNKSMFTGQPIVPDYMKDLPVDQQVYKSTSGSARAIGKAMGISPLIVQNFISSQFGTVGKEVETLIDKGLAAHGDIPKEQAAGKTVVEDVINRVYGANGPSDKAIVAKAMTDGINAISNQHDKQLAKAMLAKNDDKNFVDSAERNVALLDSFMGNKQLYNFFKNLNKANVSVGKPADPFYDLTDEQQKKLLVYRSASLMRDAGQDYTKQGESLYTSLGLNESWYKDYQTKNTAFFDKINAQNKANGIATTDAPTSLAGGKRPVATAEQQALMDAYNALPKNDGPKGGSKTRSLWIQSHPDEWAKIQDFYAGQDAFTNAERAQLGLKPVDFTSGSGSGGSGGYRIGGGFGGFNSKPRSSISVASRGAVGMPGGKVSIKKYAVTGKKQYHINTKVPTKSTLL